MKIIIFTLIKDGKLLEDYIGMEITPSLQVAKKCIASWHRVWGRTQSLELVLPLQSPRVSFCMSLDK